MTVTALLHSPHLWSLFWSLPREGHPAVDHREEFCLRPASHAEQTPDPVELAEFVRKG